MQTLCWDLGSTVKTYLDLCTTETDHNTTKQQTTNHQHKQKIKNGQKERKKRRRPNRTQRYKQTIPQVSHPILQKRKHCPSLSRSENAGKTYNRWKKSVEKKNTHTHTHSKGGKQLVGKKESGGAMLKRSIYNNTAPPDKFGFIQTANRPREAHWYKWKEGVSQVSQWLRSYAGVWVCDWRSHLLFTNCFLRL